MVLFRIHWKTAHTPEKEEPKGGECLSGLPFFPGAGCAAVVQPKYALVSSEGISASIPTILFVSYPLTGTESIRFAGRSQTQDIGND